MDVESSFVYHLSDHKPSIDWQARGDAFVEYLREAMPVHFSALGWRQPGGPAENNPFLLNGWRLVAENLDVCLLLIFSDSGAELFATSSYELTSTDELEPWLGAVTRAGQRVLEGDPEWSWVGVIGTDTDYGGPLRLTEDIAIGTTRVSRSTNPHSEYRENCRTPSLTGGNGTTSFPVVIRGTARGYSWESVSSIATEDATVACALLSLASATYWRIREQPRPDEGQTPTIPEWRWGSEEEWAAVHLLGGVANFEPPAWLTGARELVEADEVFARSLLAYHQGLLLEQTSPSFALVCFTGLVEGIGTQSTDDKRNREQLRAGLRTALDETATNELLKLWKPRSSTAHSGKLHAGEGSGSDIVGFLPRYFSNEPSFMNFRWQTLRKLQNASRAVLLAYLKSHSQTK